VAIAKEFEFKHKGSDTYTYKREIMIKMPHSNLSYKCTNCGKITKGKQLEVIDEFTKNKQCVCPECKHSVISHAIPHRPTDEDKTVLEFLKKQTKPMIAMEIAKGMYGTPNGQLVTGNLLWLSRNGYLSVGKRRISNLKEYAIKTS